MNPAKWLQKATSTTELTYSIYFAPSSLGAAGQGHAGNEASGNFVVHDEL